VNKIHHEALQRVYAKLSNLQKDLENLATEVHSEKPARNVEAAVDYIAFACDRLENAMRGVANEP